MRLLVIRPPRLDQVAGGTARSAIYRPGSTFGSWDGPGDTAAHQQGPDRISRPSAAAAIGRSPATRGGAVSRGLLSAAGSLLGAPVAGATAGPAARAGSDQGQASADQRTPCRVPTAGQREQSRWPNLLAVSASSCHEKRIHTPDACAPGVRFLYGPDRSTPPHHHTTQPRVQPGVVPSPGSHGTGQGGGSPEASPRLTTMPLTQRIELRVDDAFANALTDLASRLHKSRAEVIRDALNFYSKAVEDWDREHAATLGRSEGKAETREKAEPCVA